MSTYQFESDLVAVTENSNGTVEFEHSGVKYKTNREATFDNSPSNNYSTYSATLYAWSEEEKDWDDVGKIQWDIIGNWQEIEDESEACDWSKFSVYF
jgi:hypothetical protein